MFFSDRVNLHTKINSCQDDSLQKFVNSIWQQISKQLPILGYILVSQQNSSPNTIEAVFLSNTLQQDRINYSSIDNLKLHCYESESKINLDSSLSGYIFLLTKTNKYARYLVLLCDREFSLSPEQEQIIKTYNQLLQQYLCLEDKYRKQENKLKLLEDLFYQMGHQLRTPLAEISIMAETICLGSQTDFCQCQAKAIQNKIGNLNLDIGNFIRSYKKAETQQNTQDIKKILQESIAEFTNLIKNKKNNLKYPQKTIYLTIDKLKLRQIFDNLLSNAIYFSPEEETIEFSWQSFQSEILITICDRGCGLSAEDRQNMFLPFYSRRKDGQGLGLAIVRKIILDLKGNIWAENIPQGGTKISLVLPKNN